MDRAQVGPHLVELRAYTRDVPSEEEGTLLYTETTTLNSKSPTTWTLRIPVNKFLVIPENDSTVRALARQLSTQPPRDGFGSGIFQRVDLLRAEPISPARCLAMASELYSMATAREASPWAWDLGIQDKYGESVR